MIKVLFTSVGRRVELMQAFKSASEKTQLPATIYGADITNTAPALCFCDEKIILPRINDKEYIPVLLQVCRECGISAVIPTIDTDLLILAQNRIRFEEIGTKVFISDPEKVSICRDKRLTADYLIKLGLNSPKPVDKVEEYEGLYPAFIKPKDGSSSINAYKVNDEQELIAYSKQVPDYIIQHFIEGVEYTVDVGWLGVTKTAALINQLRRRFVLVAQAQHSVRIGQRLVERVGKCRSLSV